MKQALNTTAAGVAAADAARLRPDRGCRAYPWHLGDFSDRNAPAAMNVVITESKLHHRWPGDPSS